MNIAIFKFLKFLKIKLRSQLLDREGCSWITLAYLSAEGRAPSW